MNKLIWMINLVFISGYQTMVSVEAAPTHLNIIEVLPQPDPHGTDRMNRLSVRFNQDVVDLTDMLQAAQQVPITVTPTPDCNWYWVNRRLLACDLAADQRLRKNTHYQIKIAPTPLFPHGPALATPYHHRFDTTHFKIAQHKILYRPKTGKPVVQVTFNQKVARDSLTGQSVFVSQTGQFIRARIGETNDKQTGFTWFFEPTQDLKSNQKYSLTFAKQVQAVEGHLGLSGSQKIALPTQKPFKFIAATCHNLEDIDQNLTKYPGETAAQECHPEKSVKFSFSAPINVNKLVDYLDISPPLTPDQRQQWQRYLIEISQQNLVRAGQYHYLFLSQFRGRSQYRLTFKKGLPDIFGRTLLQDQHVEFGFGLKSAMADMIYDQVIIEKQPKIDFPLYSRNLKQAQVKAGLYSKAQGYHRSTFPLRLSSTLDQKIAIPLKPQHWLKGQSGLVVGHLQKEALEGAFFRYPEAQLWPFLAQVTPFNVHLKMGARNGLVWVTDFAQGTSVASAQVSVRMVENVDYYDRVKALLYPDYHEIFQGTTDAEGILKIGDPQILAQLNTCLETECVPYLMIEKETDIAVLPISYRYESPIHKTSGGDWLSRGFLKKNQMIQGWGLTAQGVHRPGDQVSFKIFFKQQTAQGLKTPKQGDYAFLIKGPDGKILAPKQKINLSETGSFAGHVRLPADAMLGWYKMVLFAQGTQLYKGGIRFLVTEFIPASFKVETAFQAKSAIAGQTLPIKAQASLYSGGAYQYGQIQLSLSVKSRPFRPDHPQSKGYQFNFASPEGEDVSAHQAILWEEKFSLENHGKVATDYQITKEDIIYGQLTLEGQVPDERGKRQSHRTVIPFAGRDRFIGLKSVKWLYHAGKSEEIPVIATDITGMPQAGTKINIQIQRQVTKKAAVKSAGATYVDQYITKWESAGYCQIDSGHAPQNCRFSPPSGGVYRMLAIAKDTQKRPISSQLKFWVTDPDKSPDKSIVWQSGRDTSLTLIPEKTTYTIGDTVKILVQNPYPDSEALVTIERHGILWHKRYRFKSASPVIEVPITGDYAPKAYICVTIFSPRQKSQTLPALGEVDLAKPSQKSGYLALSVTNPKTQLTPVITTDKQTYQPGEHVTGRVSLPADQAQKVEYALVVIDQAVLDLMPASRQHYDPILGLSESTDLGVMDFQLITQLLGRQKISRKGATLGGDGLGTARVQQHSRDNFKEIAYWDPIVISDDQGQAPFAFSLPDNLTGWSIFAIAMTPGQQRGVSSSVIKVQQKLEIKPALPTHLREGDQTKLAFNLYNRTDQAQSYQYRWSITHSGQTTITTGKVFVPAYQQRRIDTKILVPGSLETRPPQQGHIQIALSAVSETGSTDAIKLSVPVIYKPIQTIATLSHIFQDTDRSVSVPISLPSGYAPEQGYLEIRASASAINEISSLFDDMGDYPYQCWEQRSSRAYVASQFDFFKADLPSYISETGWPNVTDFTRSQLAEIGQFQQSNGGMSYYGQAWSQADPGLSAYTALMLKWIAAAGYEIPGGVTDRLSTYLTRIIQEEEVDQQREIVRLITYLARSDDETPSIQDILRAYPTHSQDLFLHSLWLELAVSKGPEYYLSDEIEDTLTRIMSQGRESATSLSFNLAVKSNGSWHSSDLRTQCGILSALTHWQGAEIPDSAKAFRSSFNLSQKLPLLVNGIEIAIKNKVAHYGVTTQEASFCTHALRSYREIFEKSDETHPWQQTRLTISKLAKQASQTYQPTSVQAPPLTLTVPLKDMFKVDHLDQQSVAFQFEKQGKQTVYTTTKLNVVPLTPSEERRQTGLPVRRDYSVFRQGVWQLVTDKTHLKRGETVRVDLYITPGHRQSFVVVNDPVPSAFEPINTKLATHGSVKGAELPPAKGAYWWRIKKWSSDQTNKHGTDFRYQEIGHKSVRFHALNLSQGPTHLRYYAQIVASGYFQVPPVIAENMYQPEVRGQGRARQIYVMD